MLAVTVGGLATPAQSLAGGYTVHVCDADSGNRVSAISFGANGSNAAYPACPADGSGHRIGFVARSGLNGGTTGWLTGAWATFSAPGGTTISSVSGHLAGRGVQGFGSSLQSSTDNFGSQQTVLANCVTSFCAMAGSEGGTPVSYSTPGATAVRLLTICGNLGGCSMASTGGWPYAPGWTSAGDMQVNIRDDSQPSVNSVRGAAWAPSRWHRGTESIGFGASDNTGVRRTFVQVDGDIVVDRSAACDYAYAVPCPNQSLDDTVDTARLSDGAHTVVLAAQDTAGNWNDVRAELDVDNHDPANPNGVTVAGGENTWHNTNSFDISWTNPAGQASPIAAAHYTIYDGSGNPVASGARTGSGVTSITGLAVPAQGDYTLKVYLEDAAGNANPATASDPVHLKYDDLAPGLAEPQHRNGWVDAAHAAGYVQHIRGPLAADIPVSGIDGYSIAAGGSAPGTAVQVSANRSHGYEADAPVGDLAEGVTQFRARAISGAGIPSTRVGTEDIYVDRTAPEVTVEGDSGANEWRRGPVALRLMATDPGRLSGMAGAEPADPRDVSGAYITYAIDGGPSSYARGPVQPIDGNGIRGYESTASAPVNVAVDGRHTVVYSAFDVAGNESRETSVSFKIDGTAPELIVFEAQNRDDPRLVNVAAADATSGLADGGKIQLRRLDGGDWITLRTNREGSRYYAHIDNAELPDGEYEFRASVPDQAGNVAVGDRNRRGEKQVLHIDPTHVGSYRTTPELGSVEAADAGATVTTRITAGVVIRTKARPRKCKKAKARKGHRRCTKTRRRGHSRLVKSARIGYGKRAVIKGTVAAADGRPLPDVEVTVLGRASSDGARFVAERALRTDRTGAFSYTAKAGPSRTLDFAYRGDSTYKHADGYVKLKVPAAASIRASRKSVRNGSSVIFKGKLPGKPYPTKGKIVDLQAFYRHKWRTFATARASRRGAWKFLYRFEATRGRVVYPFRIRVRASSDYAYELGYSKTVRVTVSG